MATGKKGTLKRDPAESTVHRRMPKGLQKPPPVIAAVAVDGLVAELTQVLTEDDLSFLISPEFKRPYRDYVREGSYVRCTVHPIRIVALNEGASESVDQMYQVSESWLVWEMGNDPKTIAWVGMAPNTPEKPAPTTAKKKPSTAKAPAKATAKKPTTARAAKATTRKPATTKKKPTAAPRKRATARKGR